MSLKNYIFSSINTKTAKETEKFATIRVKKRKPKRMTVVNEENGSFRPTTDRNDTIATTATSTPTPTTPSNPTHVTAVNVGANGTRPNNADNSKVKRLLKLWTYISVEPLILCWLLPSCFLFIAVENLALEKVRRKMFKIH